jgi:serine protease
MPEKKSPDERRGASQPGDEDPVLPPATVLRRHGGRELVPIDAVALPGQRLRSTAYVTDRLLMPAKTYDDPVARAVLERAADTLGLRMVVDDPAKRGGAGVPRELIGVRVRLVGADGQPSSPDAWRVLQAARAQAKAPVRSLAVVEPRPDGFDLLRGVGLDHLGFATVGVIGSPYHSANPYHSSNPYSSPSPVGEGAAIATYAVPGWGGRQPVNYLGPSPRRQELAFRRPVVAVLDTGSGNHPWLEAGVVKDLTLPGDTPDVRIPIGYTGPDPEQTGDLTGPMDGSIDAVAGHGTFICGLVRQVCPDADLLIVRLVQADGTIVESDVILALAQVYELARRHAAGEPDGHPVDVVSLSFGYYHELPEDPAFDPVIYGVLEKLGRLGVAVVASAGNDATRRQLFPAAFTPNPDGPVVAADADCVPVLSVGARNPDGTVALFSNGGSWVRNWEPGAAVVSTMPVTFNGGDNAAAGTGDPSGQRRQSLDPDNFSAGFGVWSGCSFATPVLAARVANELIVGSSGEQPLSLNDLSPARAVERAWRAVAALAGLPRP